MAYRVDTNVLVLAEVFETKISLSRMTGWAQAALGNATDAEGASIGMSTSFARFVKDNWLSGQAMDVSSPEGSRDSWMKYLERGWHHRDMVAAYTPKPRNRWTRQRNISLYHGRYALNYLFKNLRATGNEKFMQKAWRQWKGSQKCKDDLNWMFEKGLAKMLREKVGE